MPRCRLVRPLSISDTGDGTGFLRESVQPGKQPLQVLADHSLICQEHAQTARQSSKQYVHCADGNYRLSVIFVATYGTPGQLNAVLDSYRFPSFEDGRSRDGSRR
jgi:hypothetical protein